MDCTKCGAENPESARFCIECAAPFPLRCPSCGADNPPWAKFCAQCAKPIEVAKAGSPPVVRGENAGIQFVAGADATPVAGERKTVTALFADLKGSTALMEELDPEEARAIIDPALRIMIDAVKRYDGYVVQSTGDGIFALFGAPAAYEDHPQRGLYAALQMQRELREHGERRAAGGHAALEARVGVNTGEVVVRIVETGGRAEYTPIGHTTNLASRLQTIAPAGSIAISEHTRKLIEGYFETRALGPAALRGISEEIDVYEVTGLGSLRTHFELSARRGLTKFVGRERELEQMRRARELTMSGQGQMVAVVAEAGTGKSRLYYEFKATLPDECKVLEAYSVSHGKASAWLPVLELLRKYFGIADGDDAAARREKVRAALTALDPALQDTLPYLFGLLGIIEGADPLAQMDPQIKKQRTLDAIKRIVVRESVHQPLIVIFEDLHWIDEQTQALLDLLADSIANARVLLLVNYRPEYRHEWGNKSHYVQIGLKPLGRENAEELLAALLGDAVELLPLKRLIIERTGGNPFFIEEMVQALFDEGALLRNGMVKVTRSLSQLRLPPTVQGILAARIDRLSAEQKELLQTMAVIGRESPRALIGKMTAMAEAHLERMLAELRAAEFIYEQPAPGDTEYVFKHALTQEVAYNSLLIERRKQLHERAGQALEAIFADQLDDHLTQLAHHYRYSDNVSKAVEYLRRAGEQAMRRTAYAEAASCLNVAINLLQKLPESDERIRQELHLQLSLSSALFAVKGYGAPESERVCIRVQEICERLGDPPELFRALLGIWVIYFVRGQYQSALALAQRALQRAQRADDSRLLMFGHSSVGLTLVYMGELRRGMEFLENALAPYYRDPDQPLIRLGMDDAVIPSLGLSAYAQWHLGYADRALETANDGLVLAQRISRPFSLIHAKYWVARIHLARREARMAQELAEETMALADEHGFAYWSASAIALRGCAMAAEGRSKEGIALIEEGLSLRRTAGADSVRPYLLTLLAEANITIGHVEDGRSALKEALTIADQHQGRHYEAEIHRISGELVLTQADSNSAEAHDCFARAIEIARKQSAKTLELRATMSLARLLASQGRRDEARTMLADIYNWFTEGFDTADLKNAKALLEELKE